MVDKLAVFYLNVACFKMLKSAGFIKTYNRICRNETCRADKLSSERRDKLARAVEIKTCG